MRLKPLRMMVILCLYLVFGLAQAASPQEDRTGAREKPLVVEVRRAKEEDELERRDQHERESADRWSAWIGVGTMLILIVQAAAFGFQARSLRRHVDAATHHGNKMGESVREAARASAAMESVAIRLSETVAGQSTIIARQAQQMRAYLVVNFGGATYQDDNFRFGAGPTIENVGFTPARSVAVHVKAAVLPNELPEDFDFDVSEAIESDIGIGPRQTIQINVIADKIPDEEVEATMAGGARRLFVWGAVLYEDVSGDRYVTNFCHHWQFFRSREEPQKVMRSAYYYRRHNNAT